MSKSSQRKAWTSALAKPALTKHTPALHVVSSTKEKRSPHVTLAKLKKELLHVAHADTLIPDLQEIPIHAVPKPRMSQRDKWAKRPCVLRYRAFCDELRLRGARLPHRFGLTFILAMPDSWPETWKQEMDGKEHLRRPDLANLLKAVEDALVANDEILCAHHNFKYWGRESKILIHRLSADNS